MSQVKKAILPAAGWGTRFLPATKAQPKEMLPLIDKPAIQYIVEEVLDSGVNDVLIITGKNKRAIEDHFDHSVELAAFLKEKNNEAMLDLVEGISKLVDIHYMRQKEQLGLGHAVFCGHTFVHQEPFAVLLSDDVIVAEEPCLKQMIDAYEKVQAVVVAIMEVPADEVNRYGIVAPVGDSSGDLFQVAGLVEKPSPDNAPSNMAVIGRYILLPEVMSILESLPPGAGGEIQLTDALNILAQQGKVYAYRFKGKRYDIGDKLGFLQATVEMALRRPDISESFSEYLTDLIKKGI